MLNITNHGRRCKSKPQRDTTSYLLGWLLSKIQEITNVGEDVDPEISRIGDPKSWGGQDEAWGKKGESLQEKQVDFQGASPLHHGALLPTLQKVSRGEGVGHSGGQG